MATCARRSARRQFDDIRIFPGLMVALALLASASLAWAQVGNLQEPAAASSPQSTGTGRITGQVVAADNEAPVKRAQVTLMGGMPIRSGGVAGGIVVQPGNSTIPAQSGTVTSGLPPGMVRRQAETDDGGRFEFTELPAGQFSVMVSPATGFVRPDRSESVKLTDGQSASVMIRLGRAGAITGRVLDESGEPLARVSVRAMRRDSTTGGRLLSVGTGGFATTDDLGHFRLYDLPPGDYYVAGTYNGMQSISMADPRTASGPRIGYGPTYYPGSVNLEGARRVAVRSGQDTGGIEFSLQRVPLGRVLGTAFNSTGRPLVSMPGAGTMVSLSARDELGGRGSSVRPDGSFVIMDVTPGDYYLSATLTRGQGPDAEREGAYLPVTVNGNDVTVTIQTNTGATLSGRVIVEGTDSATVLAPAGTAMRAPRMMVSVRSDPNQSPSIGSYARPTEVAEDGTFELKGVRGSIMLMASGSRGILKSVFRGGQDVTTKPMTFQGTERVTDIVIAMTTDTASLQGIVTNSRGQPAPGVSVVVFPDDPDRWFSGSPFVAMARTLASVPTLSPQRMTATPGLPPAARWTPVLGGFFTPRLLPGRYWVAALPDGNAMPPSDRESLEKLSTTATSVTVTAGEAATVQVRLPK